MTTEPQPDPVRELILLEQNRYVTRTSPRRPWPAQLGVAVGTVNWHLKRLWVSKGYVKVKPRPAAQSCATLSRLKGIALTERA